MGHTPRDSLHSAGVSPLRGRCRLSRPLFRSPSVRPISWGPRHMPQPTPSSSPAATVFRASDLKTSGARLDVQRAEQLMALRQAVGSSFSVIALLGHDLDEQSEWGSVAFLAREEATGSLVVAALNERLGPGTGYDVTLWRSLEESLPGPTSW